jgi:hypothetical protein
MYFHVCGKPRSDGARHVTLAHLQLDGHPLFTARDAPAHQQVGAFAASPDAPAPQC